MNEKKKKKKICKIESQLEIRIMSTQKTNCSIAMDDGEATYEDDQTLGNYGNLTECDGE